jgi:hypothetical protein
MPQFFKAQPYAWRGRQRPEEFQSSLTGDLFRAIGGVGSAYFQNKETQRLEEIERAEREADRSFRERQQDIDVADLRLRHRAVTGDTPIGNAVRDPLFIPGPAGQLSAIDLGEAMPERRMSLDEALQAGVPVERDVAGLGRIEIPPEAYSRFQIGEEEFIGTRGAEEYVAGAQADEARRVAAERNRQLGVLAGNILAGQGGTPGQVALAEEVAAGGEGGLPAGAVTALLKPPEVGDLGPDGNPITPTTIFNAQRDFLREIERIAAQRVEASRSRSSPDKIEGERRFATQDEVIANIERERGFAAGSIREAQRAIAASEPWPSHLFAAGALPLADVNSILDAFGDMGQEDLSARMREYGYDDDEISQVLNAQLERK